MFDAFSGRSGPGSFRSAARSGPAPRLEFLEDRDVPAVISGCVYQDSNGNGLRDAGELAIANSTIQLYDGSNQLIGTTVTDSMGMYTFSRRGGVDPQPGQVVREVVFDEHKTNVSRNGALEKFDSSLGTLTSVQLIAEGSISSSVILENLEDQAAQMESELKGSIRFQVNGKTLAADPTQKVQATVSAFDGQADFAGTSTRDFGVIQLAGGFQTLTLTSASDLAGFIGPGTVNVGQTASMQACACGTGNLMALVRSATQGKVKVVYTYQPRTDLPPGTYKVVQVNQPAGFGDGLETRGNRTPIAGTNRTDFITVGIVSHDQQSVENCFGETRLGSLSGIVYHDVDKSARYNAGDRGLGGIAVTLTGVDLFGAAVTRSTTTDGSGNYRFLNLQAGSYTVREGAVPTIYQQGWNNAGSQGGTVSGDSITMRLGQAVNAINYNFGEILRTTTPPTPPTPPDPLRFPFSGKGLHITFGGGFKLF